MLINFNLWSLNSNELLISLNLSQLACAQLQTEWGWLLKRLNIKWNRMRLNVQNAKYRTLIKQKPHTNVVVLHISYLDNVLVCFSILLEMNLTVFFNAVHCKEKLIYLWFVLINTKSQTEFNWPYNNILFSSICSTGIWRRFKCKI